MIQAEIIRHLKNDKRLSPIVDHFPLSINNGNNDVFEGLIRSIVSQQLSVVAAKTIYYRFKNLLDNKKHPVHQIITLSLEEMRSVGLSAQKSGYIKNVAEHFENNNLFETDWSTWSDEEIIQELTKIKGLGKWTVEMILMFSLNRPDVLPLDDLIIRNNMSMLYGVVSERKQLLTDLTAIAEAWRPYRSYACYYLWAAKNSPFIPKILTK